MRDPRVVFITHYTELYGANRSLLDLIDGFSTFGISNILVVTPGNGKVCDELKKRSVEYCVIPFVNETYIINESPGLIKKIAKLAYNWYIVIRYAKHLQEKGGTIIHSNSSATLIGAYFSFWMRVPHIWHIREFGLEDYNLNYNFGYRYFKFWLDRASAVIAISKAIYEKRVEDCKALKKEIVYNGVIFSCQLSERSLPLSQKLKQKNSELIFGIIGLICKEKGQEEAVEAFNLFNTVYKNAKLIIAGNGAYEYIEMLKQKVKIYGLEKEVVFTGFIEQTDEFYNKLDCLLMCSKNEAFGRVTIEAMGHSVPVIGYDNAGTSEIIKPGYNGLHYLNGPAGLSEIMLLLAENKEMRYNMARNALQTVKENFTIDAYSRAVHDVYQSV